MQIPDFMPRPVQRDDALGSQKRTDSPAERPGSENDDGFASHMRRDDKKPPKSAVSSTDPSQQPQSGRRNAGDEEPKGSDASARSESLASEQDQVEAGVVPQTGLPGTIMPANSHAFFTAPSENFEKGTPLPSSQLEGGALTPMNLGAEEIGGTFDIGYVLTGEMPIERQGANSFSAENEGLRDRQTMLVPGIGTDEVGAQEGTPKIVIQSSHHSALDVEASDPAPAVSPMTASERMGGNHEGLIGQPAASKITAQQAGHDTAEASTKDAGAGLEPDLTPEPRQTALPVAPIKSRISVGLSSENTAAAEENVSPRPAADSHEVIDVVQTASERRDNAATPETPQPHLQQSPQSIASPSLVDTQSAFPEVSSLEEVPLIAPSNDVRGGERASVVAPLPPGAQAPDMARQVASQIADVARISDDGRIEISLKPEELGRLSLTFNNEGGAMTVSLSAERPETLDLLRRNIDQLDLALGQLGYGDVTYDFAGGAGEGSGGNGNDDGAFGARTKEGVLAEATPALSIDLNARADSGGMDIRL